MKRLILTVGLPRSGKTTWAREQGLPIVNPDSIRLALHGQRFATNAEPFVWASAKLMVRALFLAGHDLVILDATNVSVKRRTEWFNPAEWACYFKVFDTPAQVCRERASVEGDEAIVSVIDRMAKEFQPLGINDMIWEPGKRF